MKSRYRNKNLHPILYSPSESALWFGLFYFLRKTPCVKGICNFSASADFSLWRMERGLFADKIRIKSPEILRYKRSVRPPPEKENHLKHTAVLCTVTTKWTMAATPWTKANKFTITPLNTAIVNSLGWRFETLLSMLKDFTHNRWTRTIQRHCDFLKIFLLPEKLLNTMPLCFG